MRHASERVPGKNMRPLCGCPLYHHIVRTLLACEGVDQILIDTDSPAIREDCRASFPGVLVVDRPAHLCGGHVPMNDVLLHDVEQFDAEVFLQTHSTNPLLRTATLERAIAAFRELHPARCDSLFSVTAWHTRLWDHRGQPLNHDPAVLQRTQDLEPVYEENSNIYLFTRSLLRRHRRRIGPRPHLFAIDRLEAVDIDDEEGFQMAEALMAQRQRGGALAAS
jgi:CMP-N-acetylneuraminic acid synthetase